jgi:hypothetical protein
VTVFKAATVKFHLFKGYGARTSRLDFILGCKSPQPPLKRGATVKVLLFKGDVEDPKVALSKGNLENPEVPLPKGDLGGFPPIQHLTRDPKVALPKGNLENPKVPLPKGDLGGLSNDLTLQAPHRNLLKPTIHFLLRR